MASTRYQFRGLKKRKTFSEELENVKQFVWNPQSQEIFGRKPTNLGLLIGYYLSLWAVVLAIMAIMMAIFLYLVIDSNYPERTGYDNLIKANPGMMMRPMPDLRTKLIRFEQGIVSTYKIYIDHIQAFLDQYENDKQVGENFIDCKTGKTDAQRDKVCRFNVDDLGAECTWQKDYGFDEGTPCILLKLNKIYDWEPESFQDETGVEALRAKKALGSGRFRDDVVGVSCEGETPPDKENIGNITFYPPLGFPHYYYPYINQEGYRQPIIFARFENPTNGVLINVWCKAWAANIDHHLVDNSGSIHFELLVD